MINLLTNKVNNKGYDWECKKHKTFGDNGWGCSYCGYPLGAKNFEFKNNKVRVLKKTINLFFLKLFIFEETTI